MKIIYITDESLKVHSVETIHIDAICRNLTELNHQVTLFAPQSRFFNLKTNYVFESISTPLFAKSLIFQIIIFWRLFKMISSDRPDLVYSRHSQLLVVPALFCKIFNIPFVLESNGPLLEETRHRKPALFDRLMLWSGIFKGIELFNVRTATKIIVVTSGIKEYLINNYRLPADKISIISNGVDTEKFRPLSALEAKAKLNLPEGVVRIGYVGSFYSWQGVKFMVESAKYIIAIHPAVKFLIVGDGDERNHLLDYIKNEKLDGSVEIRGPVAHDDVPDYINALDICLCYPTKFRGGTTSPFKVYEYLACGRPVVLADLAGMKEEFGDVVKYAAAESAPALAERLVTLIENKKEQERLMKEGREFVEQGRSWKVVAKKIATLCEMAIKK